jgi:hypothetical protein
MLRQNPMAGAVSLSLEREPDYFTAAAVEGPRHEVLAARDRRTGEVVVIGSRSVRRCYVDGQVAWLPYIGALRVARQWRGHLPALLGAYDLCRSLRRDDELPFCLTAIVADNSPARGVLEAGLPGMPAYREIERLTTMIIPTGRRRPRPPFEIQRGSAKWIEHIVDCLDRNNRRRQFAPVWSAGDLLSDERTPGLRPEDFFMAMDNGEVVACLALWDQRAFKQVVVRDYSPGLRRLRPVLNLLAPVLGIPHLPAVGRRVETAFLSHVAVDGDDPAVLVALAAAARCEAKRRGIDSVALALSQRSPMLPAARAGFRHRPYHSILYTVNWDDAPPPELDGRVAHPEGSAL